MRDAEAPGKEKEGKGQEGGAGKKGEEPAAPLPPPKPLAVLRANAALIEKAVAQKETRTLFGRVLRHTAAVRRRLTATDLVAFLEGALPAGSPALQQLVPAIKQVRWVLWGSGLKWRPAKQMQFLPRAHAQRGAPNAGLAHLPCLHCHETHQLPLSHLCAMLQAGESAMEDGDAANGSAAEEAPSQPPPPPSSLPEVEM